MNAFWSFSPEKKVEDIKPMSPIHFSSNNNEIR